MKIKNRIKLSLDVLMLLALLLMYNKNVLGMGFHEIGGIAVCGAFIIHILLNGKWVLTISGKLFSKKVAWRNKLNWLIDLLLLICFAYILISGISISKVLFTGQRGASVMKTGHYAVSALALALTGIHLGLHYDSVILRTPARKLPLWLRRTCAIVLSVAILVFGIYQMTSTSFLYWMNSLGTVIGSSETIPTGDLGEAPDFAAAEDGENAELPAMPDDEELAGETEGGHGNGARDGSGGGVGNGGEGGGNAGGDTEITASIIPRVLLSFLSIVLAFTAATAWIDGALRTRKCAKLLKSKKPA